MKSIFTFLLAATFTLSAHAQSVDSSQALRIVKLKPPFYPPLAIAAYVSGEVDVDITLLDTGEPREVQVRSGPQMLREAAVESAKNSTFEAVPRSDSHSPYKLVYRFVLDATSCAEGRGPSYPRVSQDANLITITEKPVPICDPAADRRVRSPKCFYLWRCSWKTP